LILGEFFWFGLKIEIYSFADVLKGFFLSLALRPATLQRRNVSDEIAVFARLNDDFDVHDLRIHL